MGKKYTHIPLATSGLQAYITRQYLNICAVIPSGKFFICAIIAKIAQFLLLSGICNKNV